VIHAGVVRDDYNAVTPVDLAIRFAGQELDAIQVDRSDLRIGETGAGATTHQQCKISMAGDFGNIKFGCGSSSRLAAMVARGLNLGNQRNGYLG